MKMGRMPILPGSGIRVRIDSSISELPNRQRGDNFFNCASCALLARPRCRQRHARTAYRQAVVGWVAGFENGVVRPKSASGPPEGVVCRRFGAIEVVGKRTKLAYTRRDSER